MTTLATLVSTLLGLVGATIWAAWGWLRKYRDRVCGERSYAYAMPDRELSDVTNAARLALLCEAAYDIGPAFELLDAWCRQEGKHLTAFTHLNVDGIVVEDEDNIVIAICGTNDPEDVLNDLDPVQRDVRDICRDVGIRPGGNGRTRVRLGFAAFALSLRQGLEKYFRKGPGIADRTVWLAGHSLGGAAVSLLPYFWPLLAGEDVRIVTFGAPRAIGRGKHETTYNLLGVERVFDTVCWFPRLRNKHPRRRVLYLRYRGSVAGQLTWLAWFVRLAWYASCRRPLAQGAREHAIVWYSWELEPWV